MNPKKTFTLESLIYIISFILITVSVVSLFLNQSEPLDVKSLNRRDWLYFSLILLFSFSFYLVLSSKYNELKKSMIFISISMFVILSSYYYLMVKIPSNDSGKYQTALSLLVSSLFICAGWWTQSTINRSSQRKSHTLNLIMNQRFSDLFMAKNDSVVNAFGLNESAHPDWQDKIFKNKHQVKPKFNKKSDYDEYLSYIEGIKGLSYLLNFYEFAAVGILKGDLDSKMMYECFSGAICRIEKRAFFLIRYSIDKDPRSYENFIKLIVLWGSESLILKHKNDTDDTICNDSSFKSLFNISKKPSDLTIE